jgi:hypothetical protein
VPLTVAALELVHPAAFDPANPIWIPVHAALIIGYVTLLAVLWQATDASATRAMLGLFGACNTIYLAVDGLGAGLTSVDPAWIAALANATGATWAATLLLLAIARQPQAVRFGATLTWIAFVASAFGIPAAALLSLVLAIATAAYAAYAEGVTALPAALLIVSAVLRQHVGPPAALGLLFVALALLVTGRSAPAAASQP